jgi:hypothetical protein
VLERIGQMPMPLDVVVTYKDGSQENFYIPLEIMRGEKEEKMYAQTTLMADWGWTYPKYTFSIDRNLAEIVRIVIDPSQRMADMDIDNNFYPTIISEVPSFKAARAQ